MSLWRRVLAVAVVIAAVAVFVAAEVATALHRSNVAIDAVAMHWGPANTRAQALLAHLVDQETGERGFVITGDPNYLEPYRAGASAAAADIANIRGRVAGDRVVTSVLDDVVTGVERWRTQAAAPEINARRNGATVNTLVRSDHGKALFDTLRADVGRLQALIEDRRQAAQARVTHDNSVLSAWLWGAAVSALLIGVGVIVALRLWVLGPLRQLSAALRRVADGDLDATVRVTGTPELARVGADADAMRRRILDELERSETSRQALEQRGPVVLGLSQELSPQLAVPVPGLRYAAALRPAEGILAGDWVDILPLGNDRIALMLLDVSGHGPQAGLEAMRLKHVLTTALRFGHAPHQALADAARGFSEDERFATAVIIVLDVVTGQLRWANAGHLSPRLVPLDAATIEPDDLAVLEPTGPLLSSLTEGWRTRDGRLEVGQMLMAFSDGLTEARDAAGHEFGIDGLCTALSQTTVRDVDTAVSVALAAVRAHAATLHRDDVTVLAVTRDPSTVGGWEHAEQTAPAETPRQRRLD